MHPILFTIPAWALLALGGAVAGAWAGAALKPKGSIHLWIAVGAGAGAAVALVLGAHQNWLARQVPLHSYGALILAGFLLALWTARRRSERIGVPPQKITDFALWGIVAGLIGARLLYVLDYWPEYDPSGPKGAGALLGFFRLWEGGLVFHGALLASIVMAIVFARRAKIPILPLMDLCAPGLLLGHAVGRLGCFANGCCHGKVSDLPWAVQFPAHSSAWEEQVKAGALASGAEHSLPVHPVQLYAFVGVALIALFLYALWTRRKYDGQILGWMLVMAGVTRFFEEFLRADNPALWPALSQVLTQAQWLGLGLASAGGAVLVLFRRRGQLYSPPPVAPETEEKRKAEKVKRQPA